MGRAARHCVYAAPDRQAGRHGADVCIVAAGDAGQRATVARTAALADLDKHQCSVGLAHDQVNLATAAPRRSIIALKKAQAGLLQQLQRVVFGPVPLLFGGDRFADYLECGNYH